MARAGLAIGAQELAALAGVSYPTLNRFEKGEQVAFESVEKIAAALSAKGAQFSRRGGRIGATVPENE